MVIFNSYVKLPEGMFEDFSWILMFIVGDVWKCLRILEDVKDTYIKIMCQHMSTCPWMGASWGHCLTTTFSLPGGILLEHGRGGTIFGPHIWMYMKYVKAYQIRFSTLGFVKSNFQEPSMIQHSYGHLPIYRFIDDSSWFPYNGDVDSITMKATILTFRDSG